MKPTRGLIWFKDGYADNRQRFILHFAGGSGACRVWRVQYWW